MRTPIPKGDAKDGYLNTNAHLEAKVAMLERELAESQAREARLRAGYMRIRNANDSQMRDGDMAREVAGEMLAIPQDTSALREMIEAEREACAKVCENMPLGDIWASPGQCAEAIRARK